MAGVSKDVVWASNPDRVLPRIKSGLSLIPTYPREWFTNISNIKPIVSVQHFDASLEVVRKSIRHAIEWDSVILNQAVTYLYLVFKNIKMTLDKDWKSYNRDIGLADEEISIDNIIIAKPDTTSPWNLGESTIPTDESDDI